MLAIFNERKILMFLISHDLLFEKNYCSNPLGRSIFLKFSQIVAKKVKKQELESLEAIA